MVLNYFHNIITKRLLQARSMEGKGADGDNPSSIASAFKRLTQRSKAPSAGFFNKRRNKKAVPGTVRQSPAVVRGATYPPRYEAPETSGAGGYVGSRCVGGGGSL
jgi:hypothetical protein